MKKKTTLGFSLIFALGFSACQTSANGLSSEDRASIESSSKKWVETYNQNDWNNLAALFTPDAIMMPPNGPAVNGRDAIAEWQVKNEDGFRIAFQIEAIEGNADTAYLRGRSCVFVPIKDGAYGVDLGKFLGLREKQPDGAWLISADMFNSDLAPGADLLKACPFADNPTK